MSGASRRGGQRIKEKGEVDGRQNGTCHTSQARVSQRVHPGTKRPSGKSAKKRAIELTHKSWSRVMHIPTGELKPTTEESAEKAGERLVTSITRNKETNSAIQSSDRRQKMSRLTAIQ